MVTEDTVEYDGSVISGKFTMTLITRGNRRVILVEVQDSGGRALIGGGIRAAKILAGTVDGIVGIETPEANQNGGTTSFVLRLKEGLSDKQAHDAMCGFRIHYRRDLVALTSRRVQEWFSAPVTA